MKDRIKNRIKDKIKNLLMVCLFLVVSSAIANTNDIIHNEIKLGNHIQRHYKNMFNSLEVESHQKIKKYHLIISHIKEDQITKFPKPLNQAFIKKAPRAMVFVSLGMPKPLLKQILQEAVHYRMPLILRGLYQSSFQKTAEKIFDLVKKDNRGGFLVDPLWFRQFDIQSVPALVVQADDGLEKEGSKKIDMVYGNISIQKGLEIIAKKGDAKITAETILNRDENE